MRKMRNHNIAYVSDEEKKPYFASIKETGSYQEYKLQQHYICQNNFFLSWNISWLSIQQHIDNGVHDQLENYSSKHDSDHSLLIISTQCPIHQSTELSQNTNTQNPFDLFCLKLPHLPIIITNMCCIPFLGKDIL